MSPFYAWECLEALLDFPIIKTNKQKQIKLLSWVNSAEVNKSVELDLHVQASVILTSYWLFTKQKFGFDALVWCNFSALYRIPLFSLHKMSFHCDWGPLCVLIWPLYLLCSWLLCLLHWPLKHEAVLAQCVFTGIQSCQEQVCL